MDPPRSIGQDSRHASNNQILAPSRCNILAPTHNYRGHEAGTPVRAEQRRGCLPPPTLTVGQALYIPHHQPNVVSPHLPDA